MQEQQYTDEQSSVNNEESGMDIRYIFFILMQKWWIIAVCVILFGILSAIISYFYLKPEYSATTSLYVYRKATNDTTIMNELNVGSQLVKDSVVLLKSDRVLNRAILTAYNQMSTGENTPAFTPVQINIMHNLKSEMIVGAVTVTAEKDTRILRIGVNNGDPYTASVLANAIADSFLEEFKNLTQSNTRYSTNDEFINVIDKASPNTTPVKPDKRTNIILGLFAGAAVGAGMIFLLEFLDDTIKSPEAIRLQHNIDILGVIPIFEPKKREGSNNL